MVRNTSSSNSFQVLNSSNATNANPNPQPDTNSIYYVHPGDGPNTVSVTPKLTKQNYHAWARAMRRALGAKNKFHFVDGSIEVPDESDLNHTAWERCNNLIHSWIMNSVSDSIAQSIVFIDVWRELKEQFSKADRIRVSKLRSEINSLKQGSKSVTDYFGELKILWQELDSYRPLPVCTCPRQCACAAMRNAREFRLEDQVMQFLTGLNDRFSVVRTQVLLMEPLPSLNKVYSLVMQEESNENLEVSDESKILINAVDSKRPQGRGKPMSGNYNGRNPSKVCTHCGKIGHTIEVCYRKHGFPPNWGKSWSNSTNTVSVEDNSNVTGANDDSQTQANPSQNMNPPSFTKEQYESIMSLIQQTGISQQKAHVSTTNQVRVMPGIRPSEDYSAGSEMPEDDWFG